MKIHNAALFMATVGLAIAFAGCNYESPLVEKDTVPVGTELLGVWDLIPDEEKPDQEKLEALILKFSDTEYVIQYPRRDKETLFFRAYLIKIEDMTCLQTQLIGSEAGPADAKDRKYDVLSFGIDGGILKIAMLNTEIVNKAEKSSEKLREALISNRDNPKLFINETRFRKKTSSNSK